MANPSKHSAGPYPETRRDDQPENASPESAVVNLADAWNEEAQNRRCAWFAHIITPSQE